MQETQNQVLALRAVYTDAAVVEETASGVKRRPELERLCERLVRGDELIVWKLDRLGRTALDILIRAEDLTNRGIRLVSHTENMDFSGPCGKLLLTVMSAVAELDRNNIAERTRIALAARKARGMRLGAKAKFSPETVAKVREMRAAGATMQAISRETGVSVSRVYQLTKAAPTGAVGTD